MASIIERERKFLVTETSFLDSHTPTRVHQKYLFVGEQTEVRLREVQGDYTVAFKSEPDLSRMEEEFALENANLASLLFNDASFEIVKDRYSLIHTEDSIWEVDVFHGLNKGLAVAEIELSQESNTIRIPTWCAQEVTGVADFYNAALAKKPISKWSSELLAQYQLSANQ